MRWGRNGIRYSNNSYFFRAILKYGWDNIKHEILCKGLSKEEAEKMEIELIEKYKSNRREFGYNHSIGGGVNKGWHYHLSDKTKHRLSEINTGKVLNKNTREKISNGLKKAYANGERTSLQKITLQYSKDGQFINRYSSKREASKKTGISESNIGHCCNGERKSAGGYVWKYE